MSGTNNQCMQSRHNAHKPLRILCLHNAENQASYRYRVKLFLPAWHQYGIEMHPICIVGKNYKDKIILALKSKEYDYIWLQRKPLSQFLVNIIASRSKLIYDIDDALYTRQSGSAGKLKSSKPGSVKMIKRINHIIRKASLVFAGSNELALYASKYNQDAVRLIPTAFNAPENSCLSIPDKNHQLTIGWIGTNGNLPYLKLIDDATHEIQKHHCNILFSVMSGRPPEDLKTNWQFVPWSIDSEKHWLQSIDIGIMPLFDDEWSRGKCAFKLIQYMAYGKPVIASDVGANKTTVEHGRNGFLARSSENWSEYMNILILDEKIRSSMGQESKKIFFSSFERQIIQDTIADILFKYITNECPKTNS